MLTVLTDDEVKAGNERKAFLYSSAYTVDNLTAVLMDMDKGGFGLHEDVARAKAHSIIGWLATITRVRIPDRASEGASS